MNITIKSIINNGVLYETTATDLRVHRCTIVAEITDLASRGIGA